MYLIYMTLLLMFGILFVMFLISNASLRRNKRKGNRKPSEEHVLRLRKDQENDKLPDVTGPETKVESNVADIAADHRRMDDIEESRPLQ